MVKYNTIMKFLAIKYEEQYRNSSEIASFVQQMYSIYMGTGPYVRETYCYKCI